MRRASPRLLIIFVLATAFGGRAAAGASEPRDRVAVPWKRDPRIAARGVEAGPPPSPEIPAELAIAPGGAASARPKPEGPESPPVRRPQNAGSDVDGLATRAAREMAQESARVWGWREYWRAGFARGVGEAMEDPRLGAWEHDEGLRLGRSEPRVRELGDRLAREAAEENADRDAEGRVREQFLDLTREPVRDRESQRGNAPRFVGPWAVAPVLEEVFADSPLARTPGLSREGRRAADEWRVEPVIFARGDRGRRAYDERWKDPEFAFSTWRERQRGALVSRRLSDNDWRRFHDVFCDEFHEAYRSIDWSLTRTAWRIGFEDGWRYGASIQSEWHYRQGYAQGFDLGVEETATIAYPYAYDGAYSAAYDRWFDGWESTAHPGIAAVRLEDESGDGTFEPGERVLVEADLVNYGGGAGTFDLSASGTDLGALAGSSVTLTRRGRAAEPGRLSLRIAEDARLRTRTSVTVALGDAHADAPLYVSRPFEIQGAPAIDADRLSGRVTLALSVVNTSRREAGAVLSVEPLTGARKVLEDNVGMVPAGGSRRASVTFTGIHPLDLIGGESRWRASIVRGGAVDDAREIGIAPVATDLSNPDLMNFMLALAATPTVSGEDVVDARALMMERLRADWERAADRSGNPYKRDFESEGTETVLGEIVRATQGGARRFTSPQVFDGLGADVTALSDKLPGAHPLLRKWMKRLAKRVGA